MTVFLRALVVPLVCLFATIGHAQEQPQAPAAVVAAPVAVDAASEALIKLLEDPQGRAALIEQIRRLKAAEPAKAAEETAPATVDQPTQAAQPSPAPQPETPSQNGDTAVAEESAPLDGFAVQLGEYTKVVADNISDVVVRVVRSLRGVVLLVNGDVQVRWEKAKLAVLEVALVLVSATLLFWLGQRAVSFLLARRVAQARYSGHGVRVAILLLTTAADALTVVLGWGAGYAAALLDFGILDSGISLLESLALNAFLLNGLVKVGLRFIFAPRRRELRLLPFDDDAAVYWTKRLGFVVSLLCYGIMLAVPVSNLAISFVVGHAVRVIVLIAAAVILLVFTHRNREGVSAGLKRYGQQLPSSLARRAMVAFSRIWHWFANIYVLAVLAIWISRPYDAIAIVMRATGLSILLIMASITVSVIITRTIIGGIRLPEELRESLPALEWRLNAFVPRVLKLFRFIVFVLTVLLLLQIWSVMDVIGWVQSESGAAVIARFSSAVLVLLVSFGIWLAVMSWVDVRLRDHEDYVVTPRTRTLFQLFRNAFTVLIMVMALLLALSEIGVNIGPLIAGAGVVGLAISFGAQTLVKDIITGAFIQIENGINEGDVVTVGGITGTVERLTVRSVRLRDLDGTFHIVPFSSVDMVSNFNRDYSYHVAVIGVAYDTDITKAKAALEEAFQRLKKTEHGYKIIGDLEMHGVTNFGDSAIDIRARIKTTPGDQWAVGRAYNECVKEVFDEQGIEIPFPQVTYHAAGGPAAVVAAGFLPAAPNGQELEDDAPSADDGAPASASDEK